MNENLFCFLAIHDFERAADECGNITHVGRNDEGVVFAGHVLESFDILLGDF